jgi:hypothetical protein
MIELLVDLELDIDKSDIVEADIIELVIVNIAKYFFTVRKYKI